MTAFLFPGQGSQYVGMARRVPDPEVSRQLFAEASSVLGFDLWDLIESGDEATLMRTENTQPALFVTEMAWAQALSRRGIAADIAAGHSLGEFSALCYAGVFSFEDGVRLVQQRGALMAEAVSRSPGSMAAVIGLSGDDLAAVLADGRTAGIVEPANYNAVDQTVVSGETAAVLRVVQSVRALGRGRAIPLKVGAPFHSSIMAPGAREFEGVLNQVTLARPRIPVVNNVAAAIEGDPGTIRSCLVAQFKNPVQWVRTMEVLKEQGVDRCVEVGPKSVLTALAKKTIPGAALEAVEEMKWQ